MSAHYQDIVIDNRGNAIQNAAVRIYEPGTTTLITDAFSNVALTIPVVFPLLTDSRGGWSLYIASPRLVDVNVTDNNDTAYISQGPLVSFSTYTVTILGTGPATVDASAVTNLDTWVRAHNRLDQLLVPTGSISVDRITTSAHAGITPYEGLTVYETDTDFKLVYDGTSYTVPKSNAGPYVCTSSTRPTAPFKGLQIYETDTDKQLVYTTPTTGWQPPWNMPWGYVALATRTTDQTGITAITDQSVSVTWTAVANRRYRLSAAALASSTVATDEMVGYITDNSNNIIRRYFQHIGTAASGSSRSAWVVVTPAVGSVTYKLRFARTSGTGTITVYGDAAGTYGPELLVEDIGPVSAPA